MFGLIRPCEAALKDGEANNYARYYCGLCFGMSRVGGALSRFLINYDLCLAYLIADSLSPEENTQNAFCPYIPYKYVAYQDNEALLQKISERNYILSYKKILDDVEDDGSIPARTIEKAMRNRYHEIAGKNPSLIEAVDRGLEKLRCQESLGAQLAIKDAAEPFAHMLSQVMGSCVDDILDSRIYAQLCHELGAWIYIVDAIVDIEKDAKSGNYNPILAGYDCEPEQILEKRKEELRIFLVNCRRKMQELVMLLSCAKNHVLIDRLFTYMMPEEVAELLK